MAINEFDVLTKRRGTVMSGWHRFSKVNWRRGRSRLKASSSLMGLEMGSA